MRSQSSSWSLIYLLSGFSDVVGLRFLFWLWPSGYCDHSTRSSPIDEHLDWRDPCSTTTTDLFAACLSNEQAYLRRKKQDDHLLHISDNDKS